MTTVTRKEIEQQVMALQSLAMQCAKDHSLDIDVRYKGRSDQVVIKAGFPQDAYVGERYSECIPLREWCGSVVLLEDAKKALEKARADLVALCLDQLDEGEEL